MQKNTKNGEKYAVTLGRKYLDFLEYPESVDFYSGKPLEFFIKNDNLCFYPIPDNMYKINVSYLTYSVGIDADNQPIYALRDASDLIVIPDKYNQLFENALITKALMYALASPSDENYAGYAIQYEKAYKLLIKAAGGRKKNRKIVY